MGDKNTNITKNSQEVSHFPAVDHKAAMNRPENMIHTRHQERADMGLDVTKPVFGVLNKRGSNQSPQLLRLSRNSKFGL